MTGPWNAAALPEIMAGAVEESKRGAPGGPGRSRPATDAECPSRTQMAKQQASNWAASPESEEVEPQKPERGLTLRLTGVPKARPS